MKYLFFFVHPSKFHVFKNTINYLQKNGHEVKVLITSKDVLEDLVKTENWNYENIFPEGRKIKGLPPYLSASINLIKTIKRLSKYTREKKYDLFITDDLLVVNGWLKKIPTILFQDDDVTAVPETAFLHYFADHILTQNYSYMGKNENKKIPMYSYKELGYLHPNKFTPDYSLIKKINPQEEDYFILRLVSLRATHDTGKKGLNNNDVNRLIAILEKHGKVYISSEREMPEKFEKYRIPIPITKIAHALYYAKLLISDSQTMSAEAGVLGTPYIRFNDFVGKISYLADLEDNYRLGYGILTKNKNELFEKVEELLALDNLHELWQKKRERMLSDKIDLTKFMIWLFENYPNSVNIIKDNPKYQFKIG